MRRISIVLSTLLLAAMILAACGGEETSTSIPTGNVPPVTVDVTETSVSGTATEMPTEGTVTETPGIPVTGENNASRLSNELQFPVLGQDGQQIGNVSDMVLDLDNTRVSYVVVSADGREVVVPWDSLTLQAGTSSNTSGQQNAFILQTDQETFSNAPTVDINAILPQTGQPAGDWDAEISSYWQGGGTVSNTPAVSGTLSPDMTATPGANTGLATATSSAGLATATTGTGTGLATATTTSLGTVMPEGTATLSSGGQGTGLGMTLQGVMLATEVLGSSITVGNQGQGTGNGQGNGTGQGSGLATATLTTGTGLATATATSSAGLATATTGTGSAGLATATTSGTDQGNSGLGNAEATIDDLIIDTNTGDIQYIVLDTMIDNSENWIPVPLSLLQWDATNQGFVVNVNPAALVDAPSFENGQYPDTSTSGWDTDIASFWESNGSGQGSGGSSGANLQTTATPTP